MKICYKKGDKAPDFQLFATPDWRFALNEPKGEVSKLYGVYNDKEGECDRALFVINKERVIAWRKWNTFIFSKRNKI